MGLKPDDVFVEDAKFATGYSYSPSYGLTERDDQPKPKVAAINMPIIPRSEWSDRLKEMERQKALISDVRSRAMRGSHLPSMNQGEWGYCWAHSTTMCAMLNRARTNLPFVPLSAFAIAAIIKKGANEGAWAALSYDFATKIGLPSEQYWRQGVVDLNLDTEDMRKDAATRKIQEGWVDLDARVYDQNMTFDQVATALLMGFAVAGDFYWWGHSVCIMDLVEIESGDFGFRILNSWTDGWGSKGTSILRGDKARTNGAVVPRLMAA